MKKLIANLCMWILGKLGYQNEYSEINTITIKVDAADAIKSLQTIKDELEAVKKNLPVKVLG